jgi:phosphinothricin acetyltransferase
MNIGIRDLQASDAEAITKIYNWYVLEGDQSFETEALSVEAMRDRALHIHESYPYFVAVDHDAGDKVLGYCYVHPWKERAAYSHTFETTIYLALDARHHGVGRMLMTRLIEECRARGYRALIACITGNNTESISFHLSLGFKQVSHFKQVGYKHGQWLDVIDLELLLA